jgi:pSer/pThr/pTyr-binding forkhead associated (FHA) protein
MRVKLLVIKGQPQGKSLLFPRGEFLIGRGTECHIRPNSDWVSRQHCLLRVTNDGLSIRDLGSTNGTLVNGTRLLDEEKLVDGDEVQVGPVVFQVRLEDSSVMELAATPLPIGALNQPVLEEPLPQTTEMPNLGTPNPLSAPDKGTVEFDIPNPS